MVDSKALWDRINARRIALELKWEYLASIASVALRTLKRWKTGEYLPSLDAIERVARALGTTVEELLRGLPLRSDPPLLDRGAQPNPRPFEPFKPATDHTFVGRGEVLESLEEAFARRGSMSVVGDPKVGKSSLLFAWERRATAAGHKVMYLDGATCGTTARALVEAITGAPSDADPDGAADALIRWIKSLPRHACPLLLLDDFDDLARNLDNRFLQRLRGIVGAEHACFVLVTRQDLSRLTKPGATSTLEGVLESVQLGLLDERAAEQIVERCTGVTAPDGAELLRSWAGRHPFYLNLLGRHLTHAFRHRTWSAEGVENFRAEAARFLHDLWQQLSLGEQEALLAASSADKSRTRLTRRGVLTHDHRHFGDVLTTWLAELSQ